MYLWENYKMKSDQRVEHATMRLNIEVFMITTVSSMGQVEKIKSSNSMRESED